MKDNKEKPEKILIKIWIVLRVPFILAILIGFFILPLFPQFTIPDMLIVRIITILLIILGELS